MGGCMAKKKKNDNQKISSPKNIITINKQPRISMVNEQSYISNKGEDVDAELQKLQALGEATNPRRGLITDGHNGPILSIASEGYENLNPLKTNISASRGEILMIEDGGNKSSKEKQTISDGRSSSIGREIFNSKPRENRGN